jgi:Flp pilus assembly protein TadG
LICGRPSRYAAWLSYLIHLHARGVNFPASRPITARVKLFRLSRLLPATTYCKDSDARPAPRGGGEPRRTRARVRQSLSQDRRDSGGETTMKKPPQMRREPRRGITIIYLLVLLTLLIALASFAVDYGRVQLSKTQLQVATDVSAKWAALSVNSAKSTVVARANSAAADNPVNGVAPTFASSDVQLGRWNQNTRVFTPNGTPFNAVKLTGKSVIPLVLGSMVQKPQVTVHASAVALTASFGGMIGLNGLVVKNNVFVGSYDSTLTPNPTEATAQQNASISSNGFIQADNNGTVKGNVSYGPAGGVSIGSWDVSGTVTQLSTAIPTPAEPAWAPTGNPGSVPQNYVHTGGTLAAGTYYFTSLSVNAPLTFAGPSTLYVNGNILASGNGSDITAYAGRPANLTIYQIGASRTFTTENVLAIKAVVIAPRSDFLAKNKIAFYGHIAFNTITLMNTASFYYDENGATAQTAVLVQ